jgi:hypothetical protein
MRVGRLFAVRRTRHQVIHEKTVESTGNRFLDVLK